MAISTALQLAVTVLQVDEGGTVTTGRLLESTPPLGVEDVAGMGAGDKGCMASSTSLPLKKSVILF